MSTHPTDGLDAVATTSRITAAMRAAESARPDRLFDDPFAATLAGDVGRTLGTEMDAGDAIAVRTRFDDDGLRVAVTAGVEQVVLVAAGMDTRAWRLGLPGSCTLFELDRPTLLELKSTLLVDSVPTSTRVPVPADLTADWATPLRAAGFDPTRPTCWIIEGLMQYLPEASVSALLDEVSAQSAPGSHLLSDFVGAGLLASPRAAAMLEAMAAAGSPWVFGTDDPGALFAARGWACEVRLIGDVAGELGRAAASKALGDGDADGRGYLVHATR